MPQIYHKFPSTQKLQGNSFCCLVRAGCPSGTFSAASLASIHDLSSYARSYALPSRFYLGESQRPSRHGRWECLRAKRESLVCAETKEGTTPSWVQYLRFQVSSIGRFWILDARGRSPRLNLGSKQPMNLAAKGCVRSRSDPITAQAPSGLRSSHRCRGGDASRGDR